METAVVIAVCPSEETCELRRRAESLAHDLGLPLADPSGQGRWELLLVVRPDRLELRPGGRGRPGPVYVDFVSGQVGRRLRSAGFGASTLVRAVGLDKRRLPWRVCDATAGLCRDAFLLAAAGCTVTAVERSPVLAALAADGLARAARVGELADVVRERLRLIVADARSYLAGLGEADRPDAVYLDPMFPSRGKTALSKKELQICRRVAGEDPDAGDLLAAAMGAARSRVVVKRSLHAPPLGPEPAFALRGRTIRYDVYLAGAAAPARSPSGCS